MPSRKARFALIYEQPEEDQKRVSNNVVQTERPISNDEWLKMIETIDKDKGSKNMILDKYKREYGNYIEQDYLEYEKTCNSYKMCFLFLLLLCCIGVPITLAVWISG